MKISILHKWQVIAMVGVFTLMFYSCSKQPLLPNESVGEEIIAVEENSPRKFITTSTVPNPFNVNVGSPITGQVGAKWIENYKKVHGENKSYVLPMAYLKSIVNDPNCVGICMFYAIDYNNKTHILPVGINKKGKVIEQFLVPTMDGYIFWTTAKKWKNSYTGNVTGHFFGSNTFGRLDDVPCKDVHVDFAIDDYKKPQLLLSNQCVKNIAKQYEDDSFPSSKLNPYF